MADTPSSILLLRLQATGSNTNLWGGYLNTALSTLERAAKGYQNYTVTGDATLSWANYSASNDLAVAVAKLSGSPAAAFALTLPSYQTFFATSNATSYAGTLKNSGGTGIAVPANRRALLYGDGTDIGEASPNWLSSYATTLANSGDIVVKVTLEAAIAAASGLTAPFILNSAADTTAGYNSAKNTAKTLGGIAYSTLNAGANEQNQAALDFTNLTVTTNVAAADRFALYDATAAAMRYQTRANVVGKFGLIAQASAATVNPVVVGSLYPVDCTAGAGAVTFPAAASAGDVFGLIKFGTNAMSVSTNALNYYGAAYTALGISAEGMSLFYYTGASRGWIDL